MCCKGKLAEKTLRFNAANVCLLVPSTAVGSICRYLQPQRFFQIRVRLLVRVVVVVAALVGAESGAELGLAVALLVLP